MLCFAAFMGLNCTPRTVTRVEYRQVYMPVRCNVAVPPRPAYNGDPVAGAVDLCEYTEMLEILLHTCINGGKDK